jgi:hypothetical protein
MRKYLAALLLALSPALLACDSREEAVLKSQDGKRELVYDCQAFQPQASSSADLAIITYNVNVLTDMMPEDRRPFSALSFTQAMVAKDFKQLERLVVEEACKLQREGRYKEKRL